MLNSDFDDEAVRSNPELSRRTLLKFVAGAPLVFTFGMVCSPIARFFKPTMQPGEFFQAPDMPTAERSIEFNLADFPTDGACLTFEFQMKYAVFSPQQEEVRTIPGLAIRLGPDKVVAFSRRCPGRSGILNYKTEMCCGCIQSATESCSCAMKKVKPVLVCPTCRSVFDVADGGRLLQGRAPRPAREFDVSKEGQIISVVGLQSWGIA